MERMSEVSKLLSDMIDSGTFTKDALARMNDALTKVSGLEDRVAALVRGQSEMAVSKQEVDKAVLVLCAENEALRKAGVDVKKREEKMTELEKTAACSNARSETFKECFGLVFRNFTVNRSLTGNAQMITPGSTYPISTPTNENETESIF